MKTRVFRTDQTECYNTAGERIPCPHTGQDGGVRAGTAWPEPRFFPDADTVVDNLTDLMWTKNANLPEFPLMWEEALRYVRHMNHEQRFGHADWRLPDRKELFSLVSHVCINPSLPVKHPFFNVFTGYYWSSTPSARFPSQAWYVHFGGGRVFKGMKHGSYMVWPVRTNLTGLPKVGRSGETKNDNETGQLSTSDGTRQDGAWQQGASYLRPRFSSKQDTVLDNFTSLMWTRKANCAARTVSWQSALDALKAMNAEKAHGYGDWRLPNIRELESLTDMGSHTPALPSAHPFEQVQPWYWSSTTSTYDPRYAWVLYTVEGAVGVGYKPCADFFVWAVRAGQ